MCLMLLDGTASEAEFLGLYGSDHRPVVTHVAVVPAGRRNQFLFDKRLLLQPDFQDYVHGGWNSQSLSVDCSIMDHIREVRRWLSLYRRLSNLNSAKKIEALKSDLEAATLSINSTQDQIVFLGRQLAQAYKKERKFLVIRGGIETQVVFKLVQNPGLLKTELSQLKMS